MMNTSPETAEAAEPLTFDTLPLSEELRRALRDMSYVEPTRVQLAVWEPASAGKDVVTQARTGTGKTTAFGMPLIDKRVRASLAAAQALVLCPTRELALQVSRELEKLAQHKNISVTAIYGGAPMPRQVDALRAGAQIVVGTPGRVLDHLRRRTLDPQHIGILVLDEADEMLSMGFERELTAIVDCLPPSRQTLLFSATVPPDIERLARTRLKEPEFVILSGDHVGALTLQHIVYHVTHDKAGTLVQILEIEDPESAIIFCNTRDQTQAIAAHLQREGYSADWLNGDLQQSERERVMKATREERIRFLVATDVAARGIDISHLTHVINCDFPQDAESYVHRTGRTGRAGRTGTAISLVTPQDIGGLYILRLTYKIRPQERQLPTAGEQRTRFELDVIGALAEALTAKGANEPGDLALARRLLTHQDAEAIIAGLIGEHLRRSPMLADEASTLRRERPAPPPPVEATPAASAPSRAEGGAGASSRAPARERRPDHDDRRGRDRKRGTQEQASSAAGSIPSGDGRPAVEPDLAVRATESEPEPEPNRDADEVVQVEGPSDEAIAGATPELERRRRRGRSRKTRESGTGTEATSETTKASEAPDGPEESAPHTPVTRRQSAPIGDLEARPAVAKASRDDRARDDDDDDDTPLGADSSLIELHVNLGRRHGVRVNDLRDALDEGGLPAELLGRIRMRERYSFVEVEQEATDRALDILNQAEIGERRVVASISQRSR